MSELRPLGDTAAVAAAAVGPATLPATTATQPLSTEESVTENSHQTNVAASVAQDQPAPAAALDPSSTQKDTIEPVEKKEESSSVTKSIMEGTLGYKAPGLVKYVLNGPCLALARLQTMDADVRLQRPPLLQEVLLVR